MKDTMKKTSKSLGNIIMAPKDMVMRHTRATTDKPLRILVTMYNLQFFYNNAISNGLGFWVFYIIRTYFTRRSIPVRLYLKSIKTSTSLEDVINFVRRNKIDAIIPSDISDTFFLCTHLEEIQKVCKIALCPDVKTYESLEDKWCTYNFCVENSIPTPTTKLLSTAITDGITFPFFLKVSSGTNGGRGVWLIKDQNQLDKTMKEKVNVECAKDSNNIHLYQTPTFGTIVCAEVVYSHGQPLGFWFSQSNSAEDLAGVGKSYMCPCFTKKGAASHVDVNLNDDQWEAVTDIFKKVGTAASYHGMIDIEFIISGPSNPHAPPGSVWLLEMNPRFSGAIHTTLSDLGFLDLYIDTMMGNEDRDAEIVNFCDAEMQADFREFSPAGFYASNPLVAVTARNWKRGPFSDLSVRIKGDRKKEEENVAKPKGEGGDGEGNDKAEGKKDEGVL